ncbi:N-acetylserotonin O-methyltransferase-like protein [Pteropus alecto]|uniref:N-acetylserotonin O-methyltransferase-like protein n=1 Tax=Pteropus alecto TaxID=9402 RepID=L5KE04_PTEAL|nr:N-acetylserotonin O-methyltransferase-like protein [Pteropus alecto]
MMYPVIQRLLHKRVVLASASPRRQQILSNAGLKFEVVPSQFKETLRKASFPTPYAYAVETAKQKALENVRVTVSPRKLGFGFLQKDLWAPDIVIGADTIVAIEGLILEKPVDRQDAYSMLSRLNGKEHSVFTGVAIVRCFSQDGRLDVDVSEFYEETAVQFSQLSDELLWDYIDSGEPMCVSQRPEAAAPHDAISGDPAERRTDKAGGYGIQSLGSMLVQQIRGDVLNVVGFPLNHFCRKMAELHGPPRPEHRPPAALFTACKLKVFDLLQDEGPLRAVDVASKLDTSECGTGRLLDVCVALGLLEKSDRGEDPRGCVAEAQPAAGSHCVKVASQLSLAVLCDDLDWPHVSCLERAVRAGAAADCRRRAAGTEDGAVFPDASQSPDRKPWFSGATHGLARLTAHQVATAFDLSRFSSACTLGGCMGALAHELAREYPGLRVTVFDLREAVERVACFQPTGQPTEQVSFVPGDFLKDRLPEADLYIVSGVLQGWPDDKAHELLSRISGSCHPVLVPDALVMSLCTPHQSSDPPATATCESVRSLVTRWCQPAGVHSALGECFSHSNRQTGTHRTAPPLPLLPTPAGGQGSPHGGSGSQGSMKSSAVWRRLSARCVYPCEEHGMQ